MLELRHRDEPGCQHCTWTNVANKCVRASAVPKGVALAKAPSSPGVLYVTCVPCSAYGSRCNSQNGSHGPAIDKLARGHVPKMGYNNSLKHHKSNHHVKCAGLLLGKKHAVEITAPDASQFSKWLEHMIAHSAACGTHDIDGAGGGERCRKMGTCLLKASKRLDQMHCQNAGPMPICKGARKSKLQNRFTCITSNCVIRNGLFARIDGAPDAHNVSAATDIAMRRFPDRSSWQPGLATFNKNVPDQI